MRQLRLVAKPKLKDARLVNELSQYDLCQIISEVTGKRMPEPTYNKIESSQRTVPLALAVKITQVLGGIYGELWTVDTDGIGFGVSE